MPELRPMIVALACASDAARRLQQPDLRRGEATEAFTTLTNSIDQLRNMSIREYRSKTGKRGKLKHYPLEPWKVPHEDARVLELIRALRSENVHVSPFQIALQERAVFELFPGTPIAIGEIGYGKGGIIAAESSALFNDDDGGFAVRRASSPDGEIDVDVPVIQRDRRWIVIPDREHSDSLRILEQLRTDSIADLAIRAVSAAESFVQWFDQQLSTAGGLG